MSLMKSFYFKFLKENLRKSKGIVILSLIIVPLLISIYMVVTGLDSENVQFVSHDSFGVINLIFMYIIPFIYSVILFGFVFKKPSTDFMNSIPINRKTMFVTNTVGGIILITIIQAISAIMVLLWGFIFRNLAIFPIDILETAILAWCSYVFVFISANLAMTISGTLMTQFVVTVLILFLIPVSSEFLGAMRNIDNENYYGYGDTYQSYDLSITKGYQTTHYNMMNKIENYTMPFKFIRYGFRYSEITIIKMLVLSVIYYFIGLKLYEKRRMENNEESFGSVKLHIIVKALTLIPICLFVNFLDISSDITAFVVAVILAAIYYIVFDLIVKRKVAVKTTIISFALTIFFIQSSISLIKFIDKNKEIAIDYEDIKSLSLGTNSNSYRSLFFYFTDERQLVFDGNYFVDDKELLDIILEAKAAAENSRPSDENYEYPIKNIYFNIKLNSGKEYYTSFSITDSNYQKIIKHIKNSEEFMNHIENKILKNDGIYVIDDQVIDSKTKEIVKREIENNIKKYDFSDSKASDIYYISINAYQNHKLVSYNIPIDLSENMLKAISDFSNDIAIENIKGYQSNMNATVFDSESMIGECYKDRELLDLMEEDSKNEFNPSKEYYIIEGGLQTEKGYKTFLFFTNSTSEVDKIIYTSRYTY